MILELGHASVLLERGVGFRSLEKPIEVLLPEISAGTISPQRIPVSFLYSARAAAIFLRSYSVIPGILRISIVHGCEITNGPETVLQELVGGHWFQIEIFEFPVDGAELSSLVRLDQLTELVVPVTPQ